MNYYKWWEHLHVGPFLVDRTEWTLRLESLNILFGSARHYLVLLRERDFTTLSQYQ